jgi:competence protein ComGC
MKEASQKIKEKTKDSPSKNFTFVDTISIVLFIICIVIIGYMILKGIH